MTSSRNRDSRLDEDRLRRLIDAGRSVVAERELQGIFDRLLDVARELTAARYAAIGVLDESREELADFITAGLDSSAQRMIGDLPRGRGVLGMLISNPEPLRLVDVGAHSRSYGFPPGHPAMTNFLGVPILIRGEAWGNLYLTDKEEGDFDLADEECAVVLASWAAIAVENARLYRQTDQRRAELERSVRALEATSEIARAIGGETRLDRVLELIAKRSRALIEATTLVIMLVDGPDFVVAAVAGDASRELVGERIPSDNSLATQVLASGRPERISDMTSSLRFALSALGLRPRSGLFAPLMFRGVNVGVIEAFDRLDGPEFRVDDERLLLAAAASAATAVATAQSVERERLRRSLRAAEDERRRWARELHDETLQALGGLRVLLSSARRGDGPMTLDVAVDRAVELLGVEIANLRALITELRPAALDELGLGPALDAVLERTRTTYGIEVEASLSLVERDRERARLDPDVETTAYRVVQESLTNAGRHSGADRIHVHVQERRGEIEVRIMDNGHGFDPDAPAAGFGLTGMRERISLAGGRLSIDSGDGGTTITASLPLTADIRRSA